MMIRIKTTNPAGLLKLLKNEIDEGKILTWSYDTDDDFTHNPPQWNKKAWLRPSFAEGQLTFKIIMPEGVPPTKSIQGIYHGRFIEMLCTHFSNSFSSASALVS